MKIPGPTVVNLEARKGRPNTNSLHEWARNVSSHHHWANMHRRKSKLPTSLQPVISLVRQALGKLCQDAPVLSDGGSLPAAYCRSSVTTRGDTDPASPPLSTDRYPVRRCPPTGIPWILSCQSSPSFLRFFALWRRK